MARNFNATNQNLHTATAPVTAPPFTMACWFNMNSASTGMLMTLGEDNSTDNEWRVLAHTAGADNLRFVARDTTNDNLETTNTWSSGTLHHACAVAAAADDRTIYLDGTGAASSSVSKSITGVDAFRVGESLNDANDCDGIISEVSIWNVALDAAEIAALAAGYSASLIRPASLVSYWKIFGKNSPEIDIVGGNDLTVTGATAASHPRIIYPDQRVWRPFAAAGGGGGRTMGSLAHLGGLAGHGGLAGAGGGLAG